MKDANFTFLLPPLNPIETANDMYLYKVIVHLCIIKSSQSSQSSQNFVQSPFPSCRTSLVRQATGIIDIVSSSLDSMSKSIVHMLEARSFCADFIQGDGPCEDVKQSSWSFRISWEIQGLGTWLMIKI
jgi:hypothetical protein